MRSKFVSVEMKRAQEAATKAALEKYAAEGGKVTRVMEGVSQRQVGRALLDAGLAYQSTSFGKPSVELKANANPTEVRAIVEQLFTPVSIVRRISHGNDAVDTARSLMNC